MDYDPLADLLEVAAESCEDLGKISKAQMLRNLQDVLKEEPELSKDLARRIAKRLKGSFISQVS
jgi:hypothetical protein